ncbi:MAG: RAMP superfamily CRISPR-associated protein [Muribaculaceae bacterium]
MKKYNYRQLAKIVVEAASPLAIGTGATHILTDSPIATDINGLPFIPATSLAGVLRHALNDDSLFGFQDADGGEGSKIIFSDAVMIGKDGKAVDGLSNIDFGDEFYSHYANMPVRQHVKMTHRGVAEKSGKFDNQVVYRGTRFVFEIEIVSETDNSQALNDVIGKLQSASFRIGGGTRKGYGKLKVIGRLCKTANIDLKQSTDLEAYINKNTLLSADWERYDDFHSPGSETNPSDWTIYKLELRPEDFTLFGSGLSDDDADNVSATEWVVQWKKENGVETPYFDDVKLLIPASSIKGAIAHRTAYHYNKLTGYFATENNLKSKVPNAAVKALFGSAGDNSNDSCRGNVIMSDLFGKKPAQKVMHHVKIDHFTGGIINGALFQEKVAVAKTLNFSLEILINNSIAVDGDKDMVYRAFETALIDLCQGLLPLGGATNRGYGIFSGKLSKNGTIIYPK